MKLVGANPNPKIVGMDELPGKSNYFIGNDPTNWRTNVPNYTKVKYANVYSGVDLVYYGNQGQLEYDFVLQPGADPHRIALDVGAGLALPERAPQAAPLQVNAAGDLVVGTDGGEVVFHKPVVYQPATFYEPRTKNQEPTTKNHEPRTTNKELVEGKYTVKGNHITFDVANYDKTRPLVIDPVLAYSTYLGGSGNDGAFAIAVDTSGNAYVTGFTDSSDFPTTPGALQTTFGGVTDAFVSKLNAAGSALVYSTYLGGSGKEMGFGDVGYGIAVDVSGNAYVTGRTASSDFPITPGAFQTTNRRTDAFVSKLNPDGSSLLYSTYLGGSSEDLGLGIAVDASGSTYVTGSAESRDFPTTSGAFQTTSRGFTDAFVSKLNAAGSALVYSTYLGGDGSDGGNAIAVDASGNAYVTGGTGSSNFPTTPGAFQTTGRNFDAFVTKLNVRGSAPLYSTYLGGSDNDQGSGIAVDASGNAFVTGYTVSSDFPTTPGTFQTTFGGDWDVFVSKMNATGSTLLYSTYMGGSNLDYPGGIAVDASGNAYVTGDTGSSDFPVTTGAFQTTLGGSSDAFVTKFNATGSALLYSTYLGGSVDEGGSGIAWMPRAMPMSQAVRFPPISPPPQAPSRRFCGQRMPLSVSSASPRAGRRSR
jgi:hypothetical protein